MMLELLKRGEISYDLLYYIPSRRATANRMKPKPTIGIGNRICWNDDCWYWLYVDVDGYGYRNVYQYIKKNFDGWPIIVRSTRKGFHFIVLKPMKWQEVNHYLTRIKPFIDAKWVSVCRKRKENVLRIYGKYGDDIRTIHVEGCRPWCLLLAFAWDMLLYQIGAFHTDKMVMDIIRVVRNEVRES